MTPTGTTPDGSRITTLSTHQKFIRSVPIKDDTLSPVRENDVESRPGVSLAMSNVSIMQKARKIASNEPPDGWGALRCLLAQWLAPVLRQLQSFASSSPSPAPVLRQSEAIRSPPHHNHEQCVKMRLGRIMDSLKGARGMVQCSDEGRILGLNCLDKSPSSVRSVVILVEHPLLMWAVDRMPSDGSQELS
ncbi:hypothetical protein VDGL01_11589 [Verticillium dahliae]